MLYLTFAALVVAVIALVSGILALVWARQARRLASALTPDTEKLLLSWGDLTPEQVAGELGAYLETVSTRLRAQDDHLRKLQARSERMMTHRGLVRFDNDAEIKGQLSFALVLLDDQGDGFLLTSLYHLTGNRIFLRPVKDGKVEHELLAEEARALRRAWGEDV
jgi:hypothetical protein